MASGGQDLAFIDELGQCYQVICNEETKVTDPVLVPLPLTEKAKLISVSLNFMFAVTESNRIYFWNQADLA